ncbi:MAG TPA: DUF6049 family protein [Sporichthyaceae bacterium]
MIRAGRGNATAGLAAAACAFAPLLTLLGPASSHAADAAEPVQVVLDTVGPAAVKPTGKLVLRGAVINPGPGVLRSPSISVLLRHTRVVTRGELHQLAVGSAPLRGVAAVPGAQRPLPDVAPGSSVTWKITIPVAALKLKHDGVYPLQVETHGNRDGSGAAAATVTTFLPYLPDAKAYQPTRVSWLWPLVDRPGRDARGAFINDTLAEELAPGGRLADLAAAPGALPVAWMLDPEVLEAAAALGAEHFRRNGTTVSDADADADAAAWLANLRAKLNGLPVGALPYADPDAAGLSRGEDSDAISRALARAKTVTTRLLGRESDTRVAWPAQSATDATTLATLRRVGARTVVLNGAQIPTLAGLTYTPTGRARVQTSAGPLEVLIADTGLAQIFAGDLSARGATTLAQQEMLADTAMITLERPNAGRSVLIAPPRRWAPAPGTAQRLLVAAAGAPWLRLASLANLSTTPVPPELATAVFTNPTPAPAEELRGYQVVRLRRTTAEVDRLQNVLATPGKLADNYTAAALRAASTAWIPDPAGARAYVQELRGDVRADQGKVHIIGRSLVTLSSSRGTIPITISNGLSQAVKVRPVIRSLVPGRLRTSTTELLTIPAGRKKSVQIPAEATANGITRVEVGLVDAAGDAFTTPIPLRVNVTNYGSVGLIVVIGGGGLLFAVAVVRNVRRVRTARQNRRAGQAAAAVPPTTEQKVQA